METEKLTYFTTEQLLILQKGRRNMLEIARERKNKLEKEIAEIEKELEGRTI